MPKKTVAAILLTLTLAATAATADQGVSLPYMLAEIDAGKVLPADHPDVKRFAEVIQKIKNKSKPFAEGRLAGMLSALQKRFREKGMTMPLYGAAVYLEAQLPKQGKVDLADYAFQVWKQIK
jgi:predicted lipoprotein